MTNHQLRRNQYNYIKLKIKITYDALFIYVTVTIQNNIIIFFLLYYDKYRPNPEII